MNNFGDIEKWFPTSIYIKDLEYDTDTMTTLLKSIKFKSGRSKFFSRDSYADDQHHNENPLYKDINFKPLFDDILEHAKYYLDKIGFKNLNDVVYTNVWFNLYNKGDFVHKHIHQNSVLSGAFYVKSNENDFITFYPKDDATCVPDNKTELSYDNCNYQCKTGRLLLFKSSTAHSTNKQEDGEKIVISFNITFNKWYQ